MGGFGRPASLRTLYPISSPVRSASSNGPIGNPSCFMRASIARIETFSRDACHIASPMKPSNTELVMNPRTSLRQTTGVFLSFLASSTVSCTASSLDFWPRITSTRGIITAGLKKCMPTTRSGREVASAIWVMGSELVFVANTACSGAHSSNFRNKSRLSSKFSGAASTTKSAFSTAALRSAVGAIRAKVGSICS